MAASKQETVLNSAVDTDARARRTALFGTSPLLAETYTNTTIRTKYTELLNSTVTNGFGFSEGVDLIQIETPSNKSDIVPLNDEYVKDSPEYEGLTQNHTENLEEFNLFFETPEQNECHVNTNSNYEVSIKEASIEEYGLPQDSVENNATYGLYRVQIVNSDGQLVLNLVDYEQRKNINYP